jgi:hypothetical protein
MSIMNRIIIVLTCSTIFSCTIKDSVDVSYFPTSFTENEFSLDSIATELSFVPLNFDSIPVSQVMDVKWQFPYLYLCTAADIKVGRLSLFSINGELLKTMDKTGRGPGEYLSIQQFCVDEKGSVYINTWHKIVVFDKDLNHLRDIKWPFEISFAEMHMYNGNIYLFPKIVSELPKYDWVVLDTLGNVLSSKVLDCYHSAAYPPPFSMIIFENKNKLYRYRSISDTIYEINGNDSHPKYIINRRFGDGFRMYSKEEISRNLRWDILMQSLNNVKLRYLESIYGIGEYWIIAYRKHISKNVNFETVLFDCLNNRMTLLNSVEWHIDEPVYWGIPNDWIGFGAIKPESALKIGSDTYLVATIDAIGLKKMVNSDGFRDGIPKRPALKSELQTLADSLDYSSDPVLILLKIRGK